MKRAFAAWKWSLGEVTRSYRTVVVLAALIALWIFAAYEWLGMPAESSALLMILAFLWAVAQILAALVIIGGIVSGSAQAAVTDARSFPLAALWTSGWKKIVTTLVFCSVSAVFVCLCSMIFDGVNEHALEVASFLTFHSEKAVSHVPIEQIYNFIESLLWIVLSGFLLSLLLTLLQMGWSGARKRTFTLLASCVYRAPFFTSLMSILIFGGFAYKLANWHPVVPPGFWDYTQMITLQLPKQDASQTPSPTS